MNDNVDLKSGSVCCNLGRVRPNGDNTICVFPMRDTMVIRIELEKNTYSGVDVGVHPDGDNAAKWTNHVNIITKFGGVKQSPRTLRKNHGTCLKSCPILCPQL